MRAFISYSHADDGYRKALESHLSLLKREGLLTLWTDRMLPPGSSWSEEIDANLAAADLVIFLVSSDFIASDYCYDVEVAAAMQQHSDGRSVVVPIVVRPTDWHSAPFGKLQALPRDGRPVASWRQKDRAYLEIARSLREMCAQRRKVVNVPEPMAIEAFQYFPYTDAESIASASFVVPDRTSPWEVSGFLTSQKSSESEFDLNCGVRVKIKRHDLPLTCIAEAAIWRRAEYKSQLGAASQERPEYGFTFFNVVAPPEHGNLALQTALLSCPSVLISRGLDGEAAIQAAKSKESEYHKSGQIPGECACFTYGSAATGYAHWAGVGYRILDPSRAASVTELLSFEVALQSLWVLCDALSKRPDLARKRSAVKAYIARWSEFLQSPTGQEATPHALFRQAIVATSRISTKLEHAHRSI